MLTYVDESGHPHPKDSALRPVLAAVCIPRDEVRFVNQKMYNIKMDIFGDADRELKANQTVVRRSLTRNTNNKLFVDRVVAEVIQRTNGLGIFAVIMERPDEVLEYPKDIFPNYYKFLLQRINAYANRHRVKAIVAYDSRDEGNDKIISNQMKGYLFKSEEGRASDAVVESAFFVSSKVEEGIQLADLCAGIIRLHHEFTVPGHIPDEFTDWVAQLYQAVESRTSNAYDPNGHPLFGFYRVPRRALDIYKKVIST